MHELALCGAIAKIVRTHAAGQRVGTVRLQIGQLRQVVPDTLAYCWQVITEDTPLDGSVLEMTRVPARLRCDTCGTEHDMGEQLQFVCPGCGATATTVVAGEEFAVTSMDVSPETTLREA